MPYKLHKFEKTNKIPYSGVQIDWLDIREDKTMHPSSMGKPSGSCHQKNDQRERSYVHTECGKVLFQELKSLYILENSEGRETSQMY